jgi:acetyl-CoA carboxylase biotin carboxyl carrier protein
VSKSDIPLNDAEVQNIKKIISTFNDSSLNYLDLELGDLKIKIGKGNLPTQPTVLSPSAAAPEASSLQAPPFQAPNGSLSSRATVLDEALSLGPDEVHIKSPLVGRYYSQAEPGAKKYVELGTLVLADTTVALIEAMKMFNAVPSGVQGHVSKICVTDGELVEYGQILFHVKVK